ncbi:hypothetical protein EKE94_16520 [Mesobaculum littorinae]|uniref:D-galactarate dehydratase n=1 Tax=Mesobaculum littorinae TaxID=2486419 RepID=A0A438AE59_9RHOB|nr:hypothetical protein [Mesobaculum littorinae]RVV96942.1 hypothetical protein EKE94_16520 [Mesobaculum littorinae]
MKQYLALSAMVALAACSNLPNPFGRGPGQTVPAAAGPQETGVPATTGDPVRPQAPAPTTAARTADDFDTVSEEEKAAATMAPTGGETRLCETVASLGDPTDPGLWVKTPLVSETRSGRIEYPSTGKSASVELRPRGGSGGSEVSLAALRLIDAPLTDLPTLVVYAE